MSDKQYFTLVFEGNIREVMLNPLTTETIFGAPVAVGVGDAFDENAILQSRAETWEDQCGLCQDEVGRLRSALKEIGELRFYEGPDLWGNIGAILARCTL